MKNLLLGFSKNEKIFCWIFLHKMKLKDFLLRPQRTNAGTVRHNLCCSKICYFNLRSLIDFNGFFKTTASYLNKSATINFHCFRNLVPRVLDKQKNKTWSLVSNSDFLDWKNCLKMTVQKCPNPMGYPKRAIMVQKWPFLKPKSKLKSNIHQKLWNKKIFIFMNCTKNLKKIVICNSYFQICHSFRSKIVK